MPVKSLSLLRPGNLFRLLRILIPARSSMLFPISTAIRKPFRLYRAMSLRRVSSPAAADSFRVVLLLAPSAPALIHRCGSSARSAGYDVSTPGLTPWEQDENS